MTDEIPEGVGPTIRDLICHLAANPEEMDRRDGEEWAENWRVAAELVDTLHECLGKMSGEQARQVLGILAPMLSAQFHQEAVSLSTSDLEAIERAQTRALVAMCCLGPAVMNLLDRWEEARG